MRVTFWDGVGVAAVGVFLALLLPTLGAQAPELGAAADRLLDPSPTLEPGEEWLGLHLRGERVGLIHQRRERRGEGWRFRTETRLRLGDSTPGNMELDLDATLDGELTLTAFEFSARAGPAHFRGRGVVEEGAIALTLNTGGAETRHRVPLNSPPVLRDHLGPRLVRATLTPGALFRFDVYDPLTGSAETVEVEVVGPEPVIALGREVPATRVLQRLRGRTLEGWISPRGEVLRQELGLGLVAVRETEEEARWGLARGGRDAQSALVEVTSVAAAGLPASLKDARSLRLVLTGVELAPFADGPGGRQQIEGDALVIRREGPVAGLPLPLSGEVESALLAAEPLVQVDHPLVRSTAAEIVGDAADTRLAALRIKRWLRANIRRARVPGVPSALEVLHARVGDCNEHATLFAALARAAGVPTRVVSGLAWWEGRFVLHAWNEVRVEGGWLSVDATWGQMPTDPGHVRLVIGGLERQVELLGLVEKIAVTDARVP